MARMPTTSVHHPANGLRATKKGDFVFDPAERRHGKFNLMEKHWRFMEESYEGGPNYLFKGSNSLHIIGSSASLNMLNSTNLFQYFKEGNNEYRDRIMRSHRRNYSQRVVDQIRSYIARKPASRKTEEANEVLTEFWKNTDAAGHSIDQWMALVLQWVEVFGVLWLHVDRPDVPDVMSFDDELEESMPYARWYPPYDVLDAGFTETGDLKWIMVRDMEIHDPSAFAPVVKRTVYTVWDRDTWTKFVQNSETKAGDVNSTPITIIAQGFHGLGEVPFHRVRFTDSLDLFTAPGLLDDIAYVDRDIFNKQSQLDTVILDQTFSQLAMPTDAVVLNEPARVEQGNVNLTDQQQRQQTRDRIMEMGTKRVFLFHAGATHAPRFISPDADQADMILRAIGSSTDEIYRLAGLAGDVGRDVKTQSGTSKAYDFDKLNRILTFASGEMEKAEEWLAQTVHLWMSPVGEEPSEVPEDLISYPDNYSIMGLLEMIDIAVRTDEYGLHSPTATRKMRESIIARLFPDATEEERKTMMKELEDQEKKDKEFEERPPIDPMAIPGPNDRTGDAEGDDADVSQKRGPGGGAKGPGSSNLPPPARSKAD